MRRRTRLNEESWLFSYADLITNLLLFFAVLLSAAQLSKAKMQRIAKNISGAESPVSLDAIKKRIDQRITAQGLEELVRTKVGDEGLELSLNSGLVFDLGKADIRTELEPVLRSMLDVIEPYAGQYQFAVEGHTDDRPIVAGGPFPSNWELASARAIVVRQRLEDIGIDRARIRVEGYADTRPLPEAELSGLSADERAARHRRVVVRIF